MAAKVHLVLRGSALCDFQSRGGGRQAAHSVKEFESVPEDERCRECDRKLRRIQGARQTRADDWDEWTVVVQSPDGAEQRAFRVWAGDGHDAQEKARDMARHEWGTRQVRIVSVHERRSVGSVDDCRIDACQAALDDLGRRLDALSRDREGNFVGSTKEKIEEAARLNELNRDDPEENRQFWQRQREKQKQGAER